MELTLAMALATRFQVRCGHLLCPCLGPWPQLLSPAKRQQMIQQLTQNSLEHAGEWMIGYNQQSTLVFGCLWFDQTSP